jgi:hypothetical protein
MVTASAECPACITQISVFVMWPREANLQRSTTHDVVYALHVAATSGYGIRFQYMVTNAY